MTEPTREAPVTKVAAEGASPLIPPLQQGSESSLPARKASIDDFLKRNEEVLAKDREEFQSYLVAKHEQATRKAKQEAARPQTRNAVRSGGATRPWAVTAKLDGAWPEARKVSMQIQEGIKCSSASPCDPSQEAESSCGETAHLDQTQAAIERMDETGACEMKEASMTANSRT